MTRFRRLLTLLLAAGATLVVVQPASASTPVAATGTFFFVAAPVPSDFRTADGNTFVTLFFPAGVQTGDITGTFTEQLRVVTHSDGSQNVHGNATCTCTVAGRTGVLVSDNIAGTTNPSGGGTRISSSLDRAAWPACTDKGRPSLRQRRRVRSVFIRPNIRSAPSVRW